FHGNFFGFGLATPLNFHDTFLQTTITHRDTQRYANELPIGKHDARPSVPIVDDHVHAGIAKLLIKLLGGVADSFTLVIAKRADHDLERGNGARPDDSAIVVVLLNGSRCNAADANAVATHLHDDRLAVGFEEGGVQGPGVFVTQEQNVTNFYTALNAQCATARIRVAVDNVAEIEGLCFGQVALPVDASVVVALVVGPANEVAHVGHGEVGNDVNRLARVQRAQVTGNATEVVHDFFLGGETVAMLETRQLARFDFIQFMVATQQQEPDADLATFFRRVSRQHNGLHRVGKRPAQLLCDQFALRRIWRGDFLQLFLRSGAFGDQAGRFGQFYVGRVFRVGVVDDEIFASISNHLEFMTARPAD